MFFFFKQNTAYEMRIRDWSSDVCYSDLPRGGTRGQEGGGGRPAVRNREPRPPLGPRVFQRTARTGRPEGRDWGFGIGDSMKAVARSIPLTLHSLRIPSMLYESPIPKPQSRLCSWKQQPRSEEHTSELQSLMPISSADF